MTEVGHLVGAKTNRSAETMKEVIKFEAELAKVNFLFNLLHFDQFCFFKKWEHCFGQRIGLGPIIT